MPNQTETERAERPSKTETSVNSIYVRDAESNLEPNCVIVDKIQVSADSVYAQDAESMRYQDRLRYSRFQWVIVVEAAMVYAMWYPAASAASATASTFIGSRTTVMIIVVGSILVFLTSLLARKDESDYKCHKERLITAEGGVFPFPKRKVYLFMKGSILTVVIWGIMNLFNGFLIYLAVRGSPW